MAANQIHIQEEIGKVYWSISEVSARFGVPDTQIRFWETEFSILHPKRNRYGVRMYSKSDLDAIELIQYLLNTKGYTIEGAKAFIRERPDFLENRIHALRSLKQLKTFLEALKNKL
jgi:DNA-binding transcriptional MerR regulator